MNTKEELNLLLKILNSHPHLVLQGVLQSRTVPSRSGLQGLYRNSFEVMMEKKQSVFLSDMWSSCRETHLRSFKLNSLWPAIGWRASQRFPIAAFVKTRRISHSHGILNIPDALSGWLVGLWRARVMSSGDGFTTLLRTAVLRRVTWMRGWLLEVTWKDQHVLFWMLLHQH